MDTRTLERSSSLVAATSWGAILSGVFVALALQTVLVLFGLAVTGSVGDRVTGGGFGLWAVLATTVSFAIGAALAGSVARANSGASGIAAGCMMWAVATVAGNVLSGYLGAQQLGSWAPFFGAVFALGASIVGGMLGAALRGPRRAERSAPMPTPASPYVGPV